jgi:hypothetical protein
MMIAAGNVIEDEQDVWIHCTKKRKWKKPKPDGVSLTHVEHGEDLDDLWSLV